LDTIRTLVYYSYGYVTVNKWSLKMSETPAPFAPFQPTRLIEPEKAPKAKREKKQKSEPAGEKPARQKRKTVEHRAPKFDLQTILSAASTLKEADMPAFEKMIGLLQDAGKPGRERLLQALGKVFS
jgi:hypothetical protein